MPSAIPSKYSNLVEAANGRLIRLPPQWLSLCGSFCFTLDMIKDFSSWIDEGIIYAGSDGSVEAGQGAHSFVITRVPYGKHIFG